MTFKPVYESVDEIPEPLREYFPEKEGKYTFVGLDGYKPLADYEGVQKALLNERKATKAIKEQAAVWETAFAGKTPTDIQTELERIPVLEADATGKVDKSRIDQMVDVAAKNRVAPIERERDGYKGRVAELEAVVQQHEAANRRRTIFDAVREVAAKDGGFHESSFATNNGSLMLLAERFFTIDEATHNVVVADDAPIAAGLNVKDALAELGNQHPYLRKVSNGGGANGAQGGAAGPNVFKQNNMTVRADFIRNNPDKWEKAMAQAGLKSAMQTYTGK